MNTTTSAVGENVRRARRAAGLTQRKLAEHLGLEPITVSRWERGVTHPSIPVLHRIATATETGIVDLVHDETSPGIRGDLATIRREISDVRDLVETLLARAAERADGGTR